MQNEPQQERLLHYRENTMNNITFKKETAEYIKNWYQDKNYDFLYAILKYIKLLFYQQKASFLRLAFFNWIFFYYNP